jgi:hypothetical protein
MKLNAIQSTVINPSSFGMPVCGHAFETTTGATGRGFAAPAIGDLAATSVVRERKAVVKGEMGFAIAYLPGTSAWSPPVS